MFLLLALCASAATAAEKTAAKSTCLPALHIDLEKTLKAQLLSPKVGEQKMVAVTRGSPRWMAAFNAVLAWENDDCSAFAAFTEAMGYQALQVQDAVTGTHHWLIVEGGLDKAASSPGRKNGLFVLRAPEDRKLARRLVITAPHVGSDFTDDRAVQLYLKLGATALLQNAAHRCSLEGCSGCGTFPGYACGGCARLSDEEFAVDNLLFAFFAALEATRTHDGASPWLHFEYHGMSTAPSPRKATARSGCSGMAQISQGATTQLAAAADEGSYPSRFWHGLEKRLGPQCVCYAQRERGCLLPGTHSVFGRLVNQESPIPFDPCTQEATRLSGRYVHFEWQNVPVEAVAEALAEAVPQPQQ